MTSFISAYNNYLAYVAYNTSCERYLAELHRMVPSWLAVVVPNCQPITKESLRRDALIAIGQLKYAYAVSHL